MVCHNSKKVITLDHIPHLLTLCYDIQAFICHHLESLSLFFFHFANCFSSHPSFTTHLYLVFLLNPTIFKLTCLSSLSLSCHPQKQQVLSTSKCSYTNSGKSCSWHRVQCFHIINWRLQEKKLSWLSTIMGYVSTQTLHKENLHWSVPIHNSITATLPKNFPSLWICPCYPKKTSTT